MRVGRITFRDEQQPRKAAGLLDVPTNVEVSGLEVGGLPSVNESDRIRALEHALEVERAAYVAQAKELREERELNKYLRGILSAVVHAVEHFDG